MGLELQNSSQSCRTRVGSGVRRVGLTVFLAMLLGTGCAASGEVVAVPDVVDEARGPLTAAEMAAVEEFLADDSRGPATELLSTRFGVLALFEDGAASFGVDPVAEAWRYEASGPVHSASVSWDGETVMLRHEADMGPVSRQRTAKLDAGSGSVVDSHDTWGEAPSEGLLLRDVWVTADSEGVVAAHPFSDDGVAWERDLSEGCPAGGVDDVNLEPNETQLFVSYVCRDDGSAHVEGISAVSGTVSWDYAWEDASAPRIHVLHEHTVPAGPDDPIERMLDEGLSGGFLFFASGDPGSEPLHPEPWRSAPGIADYVDVPRQDLRSAPEEIVVYSSTPGALYERLVVQVARWLAEDDGAPFAKDDIDDSLLIDGELVQNPHQWTTGKSGYVSALTEELEGSFP
ncbi:MULTISPECIES: hypothetical protein [unclassified Nocardiopsis]|uniref:hypothetical protein n=1 Tax=unclassified Nocardiopsis TaxID=2649073 RepID=UPI00135C0307|nr:MULTISPECIES: hypothetical protein [unclassified Nocardiopsis]